MTSNGSNYRPSYVKSLVSHFHNCWSRLLASSSRAQMQLPATHRKLNQAGLVAELDVPTTSSTHNLHSYSVSNIKWTDQSVSRLVFSLKSKKNQRSSELLSSSSSFSSFTKSPILGSGSFLYKRVGTTFDFAVFFLCLGFVFSRWRELALQLKILLN